MSKESRKLGKELEDNGRLLASDLLMMSCKCCGTSYLVPVDSNYANGIFNLFCNDECEGTYAAGL